MAQDESLTGRQMSIGEFARRTRLPVSTLRYYHELGVLVPRRVDSETGYRYYDDQQVDVAVGIATLRKLGVAPSGLAQLGDGSQTIGQLLDARRGRLRLEVEERTHAIEHIEQLLAAPTVRVHPLITLERRSQRLVSAVCGSVATDGASWAIRRLAVSLRSHLRQAGLADPTWYGAMLPLDLDDDPMATTVFADVELLNPTDLLTVELSGGDYAVISHEAPTSWLSASYCALLDWADAQGRTPAGSVIEEYQPDGVTKIAVELVKVEE